VLSAQPGPSGEGCACLWPIPNGTDSRQQTGTTTKTRTKGEAGERARRGDVFGFSEDGGIWKGMEGMVEVQEGKVGGVGLVDLSDQKSKKKEEERV